LFVVIVIDTQFLSALAETEALSPGGISAGISFGKTPVITFERLLFHACLIQALFSGLIAGEMGEGSLRAGVKHAAVMVFIAFVMFTIAL
ncbi:MAG TPA: secretion system protein, partial [Methanoculleus sp.]|nr:secretion system protein [Methanoculleus sp.]